ncbi:carbohydrate-binding protein [Aureimonas sp. SK2]|uniref:carbohydrate-binding protein n=1 Tax=Aureimonas sp. SK2 TaxID=3015992 RepID=UPI00244422AC|nr:carbohydrate-binding protein [Aureimonas sp. SK2]
MTEPQPDWFENPAARFRTATFWFWHRIPTDDEIVAQIRDMRDKGIGCVMIQARPALDLSAYLSPAYLAAYRRACATAKSLGIVVTIYDEYGWMSGHGGGRTVDGADHLRERHMFWATASVGSALAISGIASPFLDFLGDVGRAWIYDGASAVWGDWQAIAAVAHPPVVRDAADLRFLGHAFAVRPEGTDGCRVEWPTCADLPADWKVTVFVSARCLTSRLVNYLLPETAERFAEVVYAPLLEAADGAADGFFFDHPYAGFYSWTEHEGVIGNSLLCDGSPATADGTAALLSLVYDVGPQTGALRTGFLRAYAERMHEAFFGTLARWTRERGVGFTGHELLTHVGGWALHGGLTGIDPRVMPGVDHFGIDAFRTETAVDAADFAPQLAAKFGDSVARTNGRRRCTIEQYATGREAGRPTLAGQWDLTPQRFRVQAIRHLLLGARRILLHAVNVTDGFDHDERLLANPRWDFPPAYNFLPWWDDCGPIFDELARLSAFLENGEPLRPVALLYPLETIRAEGPAHVSGRHFGLWAEALSEAGIGYDVVDERQFGTALAPEASYEVLVLPAIDRLADCRSDDRIREFVRCGRKVLWSGGLPRALCDMANLFQTAQDDRASSATLPCPHSGLEAAGIRASVSTLARQALDMRFTDGGPTWSSIARVGTSWRLAALNDMGHARQLNLRGVSQQHDVTLFHPSTIGTGRTQLVEDSDGTTTLTVPAFGIACLVVTENEAGKHPNAGRRGVDASIRSCVGDNITLVDGWTLEAGDPSPVPIAVDRGWEVQGFPFFSGTGIYRTTIVVPDQPDEADWHLELAGVHVSGELWIDDVFVGRFLDCPVRFPLPSRSDKTLSIAIHVRNTAANRYHEAMPFSAKEPPSSGLTTPPHLVATRIR